MLHSIFLTLHLTAGMIWVGSVFMGAFIDWPTARNSVKEGDFPFRFIVGQGSRVFYSVYSGMAMLWFSGFVLTFLNPPQTTREIFMIGMKIIALAFMSGFTMYGTFSTWPKMQLATHKEAYDYYKFYHYRAIGTFLFGIIASVLGLWLYL
ncbi:MAG: hypothetical protein AAFP19_03775 [Bacteroidota bacterium]